MPLSGVTPLRNKLKCGQLLVRSGLCGLKDVYVVLPGGGFRQTADPFTKIPRNLAVFAQWVCTLVEWPMRQYVAWEKSHAIPSTAFQFLKPNRWNHAVSEVSSIYVDGELHAKVWDASVADWALRP